MAAGNVTPYNVLKSRFHSACGHSSLTSTSVPVFNAEDSAYEEKKNCKHPRRYSPPRSAHPRDAHSSREPRQYLEPITSTSQMPFSGEYPGLWEDRYYRAPDPPRSPDPPGKLRHDAFSYRQPPTLPRPEKGPARVEIRRQESLI